MNETNFIRIYNDLAYQRVAEEDLGALFYALKSKISDQEEFKKWFSPENPDRIDKAIAIDAVAHAIHAGGDSVLQRVFPGADFQLMKMFLDELSGLESSNDVRKINRDFFTTLKSDGQLVLLEKQVGQTTKADISDAIEEYKKHFNAGIATKGELLTLARFSPDEQIYQEAARNRNLLKEDEEPMVVGGPASVEMVDRQGHLITMKAMHDAFGRFMKNMRTRNIMAMHSDVQVGWPLPAYINKSGQIFKSGVDDKKLWLITELRDDINIAKRIVEEIKEGNLKSYSIAGSATNVENIQKGAQMVMQVNELDLLEITLCLLPDEKVWTKNGLKAIKDINIGELVLTDKVRWRPVTKTMIRSVDEEIYEISTEHGKILRVTAEHPIQILEFDKQSRWGSKAWKMAKDLEVGDLVFALIPMTKDFFDQTLSGIVSTDKKQYQGEVHNLEVDEDHTYTTEAMVVHNCLQGVNQGAHFDILKSENSQKDGEPLVDKVVEKSFEIPGYAIAVSKDLSAYYVFAERPNSLTDAIIMEMRKMIPSEIPISVVNEGLVTDYIPLAKMKIEPLGKQDYEDSQIEQRRDSGDEDEQEIMEKPEIQKELNQGEDTNVSPKHSIWQGRIEEAKTMDNKEKAIQAINKLLEKQVAGAPKAPKVSGWHSHADRESLSSSPTPVKHYHATDSGLGGSRERGARLGEEGGMGTHHHSWSGWNEKKFGGHLPDAPDLPAESNRMWRVRTPKAELKSTDPLGILNEWIQKNLQNTDKREAVHREFQDEEGMPKDEDAMKEEKTTDKKPWTVNEASIDAGGKTDK